MDRTFRFRSEALALSAGVALDANGIRYSAIGGGLGDRLGFGIMVAEEDFERARQAIDSLQWTGSTPELTPRFVRFVVAVGVLVLMAVILGTLWARAKIR